MPGNDPWVYKRRKRRNRKDLKKGYKPSQLPITDQTSVYVTSNTSEDSMRSAINEDHHPCTRSHSSDLIFLGERITKKSSRYLKSNIAKEKEAHGLKLSKRLYLCDLCDPSKTMTPTISDDCITKSEAHATDEIIYLADVSRQSLCSPVGTRNQNNNLPVTSTFQSNRNICRNIENKQVPSETSCTNLYDEESLVSRKPKKLKSLAALEDSIAIGNGSQVKIETNDITDVSRQFLCFSTETNYLGNMLPSASTSIFQACIDNENPVILPEISLGALNGEETHVSRMSKRFNLSDSSKSITPTISDNCMIIEPNKPQVKIEVIDLDEIDEPSDLTDAPYSLVCSPTGIDYRAHKFPVTSINEAKSDVFIKTRKSNANAAVGADMNYSKTEIKNGENIEANNQIKISNVFSIYIPTTSVNHVFNVEPNGSCIATDMSIPISSLYFDANEPSINSAVRLENFESYKPVQHPSSNCCSEVPSEILFGAKHLSNFVNKQQTKKHVENWSAKSKAHRIGICEENKKDTNSSLIYLPTASHVKIEPKNMNLDSNFYSYGTSQSIHEATLESSSINNESVETLLTKDLDRKIISSVSDGDEPQLYKSGLIETLSRKYSNFMDVPEIRRTISTLNVLLKEKENSNVVGLEVIHDSTSSPEKLKLHSVEKVDELQNLQVYQEKSSDFHLSQLNISEKKPSVQEMQQTDSPIVIFDSSKNTSNSRSMNVSSGQTTYCNLPPSTGNHLENNSPSTSYQPSLNNSTQRETEFSKEYLQNILFNAKSVEKTSNYMHTNISSDLKRNLFLTGKPSHATFFNPTTVHKCLKSPKKAKTFTDASSIKSLSYDAYKELVQKLRKSSQFPSNSSNS